MLTHYRDDLIKSVRLKTDAILWLMQDYEWQFFLTGYFEGHRAGHNLWPIWEEFTSDPPAEALLDVYREIDTQLGRIQAELNLSDTALLIFSMHGMAAGYAQDHFLPAVMDRINAAYLQKTGQARISLAKPRIARMLREPVTVASVGHSKVGGSDSARLAESIESGVEVGMGRQRQAFQCPVAGRDG